MQARRVGAVVQVQDSKLPMSIGGFAQDWSLPEWSGLLAAVKSGAHHPAVDVLPTGIVWLGFQHAGRHEILGFTADEWSAFEAGVRAGEFDIDKLSTPAVGALGVPAGQVGSATGAGADRAATGAGVAGNPPAPVAAEWVPGLNGAPIDVPAGRLTGAPASLPPQGAGQPGLDLFAADQVEVDCLAEVIAEAHAQGFGGYKLARYILAAGYRRDVVPPAVVESWRDAAAAALKWGSGPLVEHVTEASRGGGTAEATGGAPPDRVGVSGGKAGPGSTPRAPGPADTPGGAS